MSRRSTRTPAAVGGSAEVTTPALVNRATPADAAPAPGGVVPAGTPMAPAVPSTEPLPSDQATAAKLPVDAEGSIAATLADVDRLAGDRPSIVPETPPAADLVAPTDPATETRGDVVMTRVPGTVPLPADQITPVAPVAVPDPVSLAASLSLMSADDRDAMRSWLGLGEPIAGDALTTDVVGDDDPFGGVRLFPVEYDVDQDGHVYKPGGHPIPLTFAEYQHFVRATAVTLDWLRGEVLDA